MREGNREKQKKVREKEDNMVKRGKRKKRMKERKQARKKEGKKERE